MDLTDRQLKHLEEIFNFFDHDKNGNVDRREVQMAFRSWGQDFSHEEVSGLCSFLAAGPPPSWWWHGNDHPYEWRLLTHSDDSRIRCGWGWVPKLPGVRVYD